MKKILAIIMTIAVLVGTVGAVPISADSTTTTQNYDDRVETLFNNNWKFYRETVDTDPNNKSLTVIENVDEWQDVTLPHDFSIETPFSSTYTTLRSGALLGGTGWYKKTFTMPTELSDKTIVLNFDGSYINTRVFVNGTKVGENNLGYTAFAFDITKYLNFGFDKTNEICVRVANKIPSERWYSGSGLYRDVTMIITDPVHVSYRGTSVSMPNLASSNGADGLVNAEVTLNNDTSEAVTASVKTTILDSDDTAVGTTDTKPVELSANAKGSVTLTPALENPKLWSVKTPNLYTLRTEVSVGGVVVDTYDTTIGFKWTEYNGSSGFYLNGESMKLKGVALHNDVGASVGSAAHDDSVKRYIDKIADIGCNAIRTAHQTLSENLMQYCAEKGIMVFDEVFDEWLHAKTSDINSYNGIFASGIDESNPLLLTEDMGNDDISGWSTATAPTWAEFALKSTMMRDRNNPAVIMWGLGNELFQSNGINTDSSKVKYPEIAKSLVKWVHDTDTQGRPATIGDNRTEADGTVTGNNAAREYLDKIQAEMDITGINYDVGATSWDYFHELYPDKPGFNSEAVCQCSDRGEYSHTKAVLDEVNPENYVFSSYNNDDRGWAEYLGESWYKVLQRDYFMGQFIWAGIDYLGEPCNYNTRTGLRIPNTTFCGAYDSAGFEKDSYYFHRSMWNDDSYTAHMLPGTWNEDELEVTNGYVPVALYSNTDKIELYLNGKLIATSEATVTRTSSTDDTDYYTRTWTPTIVDASLCSTGTLIEDKQTGPFMTLFTELKVKYEAGELSIKSYEKQASGEYTEITDAAGTQSVKTNTGIENLTIEQSTLNTVADKDRIIYYSVDAETASGEFVNGFNGKVIFNLEGAGEIVGADNGCQIRVDRGASDIVVNSDRTTATTSCYNGKALLAVRALDNSGTIKVTATAYDGEETFTATAQNVTTTADDVADEFEEEIEQHVHTNTTVVTAPTCTEQGYTTFTCTVCGEVSNGDYTDALGHTVIADGSCSTCGRTANQLLINTMKEYVENNPCDTTYSYELDKTGTIESDRAYCLTQIFDNKLRILSTKIRDYCPNNYTSGYGLVAYNDDESPNYNLSGVEVEDFEVQDNVSSYYFDVNSDDSTVKIYTYLDGVKNYICTTDDGAAGSTDFTTSADEAVELTYSYNATTNKYSMYYLNGTDKYSLVFYKSSYTDRINGVWQTIGGLLRLLPHKGTSNFQLFNISDGVDPEYYSNLPKAIVSGAEVADTDADIADNVVTALQNALTLYKSGPSIASETECTEAAKAVVNSLHTHTWDEGTVTQASTCVTKGVKTLHCTFSGCVETTTEELPLADHIFGESVVVIPADCIHEGVSRQTCTVCNEATKDGTIPATGVHTFVNGYCSVCNIAEAQFDVSVDGASTTIDKNASFVLPASTVEGFVAYTDGTDYFMPGDIITVTKNYTFTSVSLAFDMIAGAAMRYTTVTGMRYYSAVDTDLIEQLDAAGAEISLGTLFSIDTIIGEQDFTKEMSGKYLDLPFNSRNWYTESGFKGVVGTIGTIQTSNVNRNFVGRGYITITFKGVTSTIYANYASGDIKNNSRAISWIANQIMMSDLENLSESRINIVKSYADMYTGDDIYYKKDPSGSDKFN